MTFHVQDEEWVETKTVVREGIETGLADIEAGRVHTHAEVMERIKERK
jgi:predicted transcriptional regulator